MVFEEQHSPEQVTTYEVAREAVGRRLGQALAAADTIDDAAECERHEVQASLLERQRQFLRVGSEQATQIVAEAKAARGAVLARR